MNYTINPNDLLFSPYNDHSSSPLLLPIPLSNQNQSNHDHHHHHHHHHHHLLDSSPSPQFDFDPESLYAVFLQPNNVDLLPSVEDRSIDAFETIIPMEASKKTMDPQDPTQVSKKRRGKTDRHSKIYTAKGPRDRRMRLSLEVAKEFFGLQDMLGFDKASKTVDWLLTQAKPEIKKLSRSLSQRSNNAFSSDESQTLAFGWVGEKESNMNKGINNTFVDLCEVASTETNEINGKLTKEKKKKKKSQSRNPPIFKKLPKDARVKARERAKERTKEKMKMKMRHRSSSEALVYDRKNNEVNDQLGNNSNWSSFETGDDSVQEIEDPSPSNQFVIACNNDMGTNQSLDIINKWTPFAFFNGSTTPSIEHQFTDLHQFLEKPRNDFYNSQNNMC